MPTTTQTANPENVTVAAALAAATQAEQDAAEAQARLQQAQQRAEEARQHAEAQRTARLRAYLAKITGDYPGAHHAATTARGEAYARLVEAVRDGGDVFGCYAEWVATSLAVWELDHELNAARYFHGQTSRDTDGAPSFDFNRDIGMIIGRLAAEAQDAAAERIAARQAAFLAQEVPRS
jgi:hypothetical protein